MTQRQRVLFLLRSQREAGVTTAMFLREHLPRFSARIEELRKAGFCISSERLADSSWRYVLIHDVERDGVENGTAGMECLAPANPASAGGVVLGVEFSPSSASGGAAGRTARAHRAPGVPVGQASAVAAPRLFDPPVSGGYVDAEKAA